jgi:hypothetical protein
MAWAPQQDAALAAAQEPSNADERPALERAEVDDEAAHAALSPAQQDLSQRSEEARDATVAAAGAAAAEAAEGASEAESAARKGDFDVEASAPEAEPVAEGEPVSGASSRSASPDGGPRGQGPRREARPPRASLNASERASRRAYAKVVSKEGEFYVDHLTVTLGRHSSAAEPPDFLGLPLSKRVSRHHAEIRWNAHNEQWQLIVFGKLGVEVDGVHYSPADPPLPVPLRHKARLRVEDEVLYFLLPDTK